jgi:uncharacterized protein (DUF305 family)
MPLSPSPVSRRFATAAFLIVAVGACADQPTLLAPDTVPGAAASARTPTVTSAPAPSTAERNYEIKFMQGMIDHHMMAVMMSEMCLQKAVHEELRALCSEIIAAQRAEIMEMQSWLQSWYGITYEPEMKPGDQQMMDRMAAMSPAEFEVEYMERMIRHHAKAVKEGEHCLDNAYHAELKTLCASIIATQREEIAIMQAWLCAWYGICR